MANPRNNRLRPSRMIGSALLLWESPVPVEVSGRVVGAGTLCEGLDDGDDEGLGLAEGEELELAEGDGLGLTVGDGLGLAEGGGLGLGVGIGSPESLYVDRHKLKLVGPWSTSVFWSTFTHVPNSPWKKVIGPNGSG